MARMAGRPSAATMAIRRLAEVERRRLGHPYLGDEHLLLGVLAHGASPAAAVLTDAGLDLAGTRAELSRIVAESGVVAVDDAALLRDLGVDVGQLRRQLESTFGAVAVAEAVRQVRRRPWWRGSARHSPLCGPPYLIKRAQFVACTLAGKRGESEIRPEHLLYGVLRVARDPLGTGLGRRGRREATRLGMQPGRPHPVRLLLAGHRLDPELLADQLGVSP